MLSDPMPERFYIASTQRSGSTKLVYMLDSLDGVTCAGEIFKLREEQNILHPEFTFDFPRKKKSLFFKARLKGLLSSHISRLKDHPGHFGFKLMISQTDAIPHLPEILGQQGFKTVVLIREDVIAQTMSLQYARTAGKWVRMGPEDPTPKSIKISEESFLKSLGYFIRCRRELFDLAEKTNGHLVSYSGLIGEENAVQWEGLMQYLNLPSHEMPEVSVQRTTDASYHALVENHDELIEMAKSHLHSSSL